VNLRQRRVNVKFHRNKIFRCSYRLGVTISVEGTVRVVFVKWLGVRYVLKL
jgi:hypothetical protein